MNTNSLSGNWCGERQLLFP